MSLRTNMEDQLRKYVHFEYGLLRAQIYGGTFRTFHKGCRRLVGVKMAVEIDRDCDIQIDTEDFNVPDTEDLISGLKEGVQAIAEGNDLYVGCMGGIGRTGLYMASMVKALMLAHGGKYMSYVCPIQLVRAHYNSHAVETDQQIAFIRDLDVSEVAAMIKSMGGPVLVQEPEPTFWENWGPFAWIRSMLWRN